MNSGITFIEMIITIMIISIILAFSIPSFKIHLQHTRDNLMLDNLQQAMQLAHREAIIRHVTVDVCGNENWQKGFRVNTSNQVLFSFHTDDDGEMHWRTFPFYVDKLSYLPSGQLSFENGTFWYCHEKPVWALAVNQIGRVRVLYPDSNGEILDNKNKPLLC